MNIQGNPAFLLFIEPANASQSPIIDIYTRKMSAAFRSAKFGVSGYSRQVASFCESLGVYKGIHLCECDHASSSNADYLICFDGGEIINLYSDSQNFAEGVEDESDIVRGLITNSLCVHYIACHRDEVPAEQLEMILRFPFGEVEPKIDEIKALTPGGYVRTDGGDREYEY